MNKILTGMAGAALLTSTLAMAQGAEGTGIHREGFYIAPMFSYTLADEERQAGDGTGGIMAVGYMGDGGLAAVEVAGYITSLDGPGSAQRGGNELAGFLVSALVTPFARVDFPIVPNFFFLLGTGVQTKQNKTILFDAGGGYMLPFELFSRTLAVRLEGRYRLDTEQPPIEPDQKTRSFKDVLINLCLQIPIGQKKVLPPAPVQPMAVVPVVTDSDGDGVLDPDDQCPNTPAGAKVNAVGCPLPPCKTPAPGEAMDLQGCAVGDVIVLQGVNFEFDQARLTPNAETILQGVATALNAAPAVYIEIGGHTDGKGSDEYNQSLSQRRAQSVLDYLVAQNVALSRLSAAGYGEAQPIASNETDEGREQNRRVELKVVAGSQTLPVMAPVGVDPADTTVPVAEPSAAPVETMQPAAAAETPVAPAPDTQGMEPASAAETTPEPNG